MQDTTSVLSVHKYKVVVWCFNTKNTAVSFKIMMWSWQELLTTQSSSVASQPLEGLSVVTTRQAMISPVPAVWDFSTQVTFTFTFSLARTFKNSWFHSEVGGAQYDYIWPAAYMACLECSERSWALSDLLVVVVFYVLVACVNLPRG